MLCRRLDVEELADNDKGLDMLFAFLDARYLQKTRDVRQCGRFDRPIAERADDAGILVGVDGAARGVEVGRDSTGDVGYGSGAEDADGLLKLALPLAALGAEADEAAGATASTLS